MAVVSWRSFQALAVSVALLCAMRAVAESPWDGDARLQRQVTVEAEGIPIGDLLARLSEKTKVTLSARGDAADAKVIVFARRRPLRHLLADLGALFDFTWERKSTNRDAPARYELFQGTTARNREAALARETLARLEAHLARYVAALSLTPEQLAELPDGDPIREFLSAPDNRVGLALYALLTPAQRETLFTRRRLAASYAALTPPQQEAVAAVMRSIIARQQELADRHRNNPNVRIEVPRLEDLPDGLVRFRLRYVGGHAALFLSLPGASIPLAQVEARSLWMLPAHGDPYDRDHPAPTAPLPAPPAIHTALNAGAALPDRLRRLAENTDFMLLGDYYRSRPLAGSPPNAEANPDPDTPLGALDALCREPGYLWWRRGKTLLFRKRDWYLQKTLEAPDGFVLALAERINRNGAQLSIADLLRLRALTQAQIAGLTGLVSPVADESLLDGLPELLAVIAAIPSRRVEERLGPEGSGLTASDLPPQSYPLLRAFAAAQDAQVGPDILNTFTLQINRAPRPPLRPGAPAVTRVTLRWRLGRLNGSYLLACPHALPDDRRTRFRIETPNGE